MSRMRLGCCTSPKKVHSHFWSLKMFNALIALLSMTGFVYFLHNHGRLKV